MYAAYYDGVTSLVSDSLTDYTKSLFCQTGSFKDYIVNLNSAWGQYLVPNGYLAVEYQLDSSRTWCSTQYIDAYQYGRIVGCEWQGLTITATPEATSTPTPTPTSTTTPTPTPTSTATATPTPTPTLPLDCAITEVLASMDEGTPTPYTDWNLRKGVGTDDEFVEVMCPTERSIAKFTMDNGVCFYVFADDNLTGPLKVIWSDQMLESDGSACPGIDAGDTWTLNNAQSTPISTREVPTMAAPGNAWAAEAWRTPAGAWTEGTPSPGTGPP